MLECFKRGLYWRGITHDLSKFLPSEWFPYVDYFYGASVADEEGSRFDYAWLLHQKRNKHHWQWWVLPKDEGTIIVVEMERVYVVEMVCDWIGAGKAQGHFSPPEDPLKEVREWYLENFTKMQLHDNTRRAVECFLGIEAML